MEIEKVKQILIKKEPANLYDAVEPALKREEIRDLLVASCTDKNETLRYNCVRVMFRAMSAKPELFYGYWDEFAQMIDSVNGFHRSAGAQAIAYLSTVDVDCRLDRIFKHYLGLLDDSKVMVSHYFLETLGVIYRARPDLRQKIVATLLGIDKTQHPIQRRDLLKADIIFLFDNLFDLLSEAEKKKASAFANAQLECKSNKTRKAARDFQTKRS